MALRPLIIRKCRRHLFEPYKPIVHCAGVTITAQSVREAATGRKIRFFGSHPLLLLYFFRFTKVSGFCSDTPAFTADVTRGDNQCTEFIKFIGNLLFFPFA